VSDVNPAHIGRDTAGHFLPGYPPSPSTNRRGIPNKNTRLIHAGLRSAIETLRNSVNDRGELVDDPIKTAFRICRYLEGFTQKRIEALAVDIARLSGEEFDRIVHALEIAMNGQIRLAEFAYPKLQRIDHVGDAPAVAFENRIKVQVKIGGAALPPMVEANLVEEATAAYNPQDVPPMDGSVDERPGSTAGNGGGASPG